MASSLQAHPTQSPPEVVAAGPRAAEAALPPGLSAPPSLESLTHALRRRWLPALGLGLLAGLLGAGVACLVVPGQYTAQTLLQVAPRASRTGLDGDADLATYQRTQAALLKSYTVLHGTLERPNVAELAEVRAHSDPSDWLNRTLVTDSLLGPEVLRVTLAGDRAEDLAVLLNELVQVYTKACTSKEEAKVVARIKQLQENYRDCAERLRERRQTLMAREEEFGLDDPETLRMRQAATVQQLAAIQTQRMQTQMKRKDIEVELAGLREHVANPQGIVVSEFAIAEELKLDGVVKKHFDRLTEIESQMQKIRRVIPPGADSEDLRACEKERASLLRTMDEYQKSVQEVVAARLRSKYVAEAKENILKLERALKSAKEQERSVEGEVKRLELAVAAMRGSGRPLEKTTSGVESLRDEVAQMEIVLKKVGEELGNLQAELPATARVVQLEPAKAPVARKRDRQLKAAGATGFGLFGLVFLGVGLLEFRHRRVYHSQDVARGLGLNLLGTLPPPADQAAAAAAGLLEHGALAEAVDGVRTQLLHATRRQPRRVVLVTSAVAGEGKTSLAGQLAASLARSGQRTLLLDGDLRDPSAHRAFGLPERPGFAEALRGEAPVEQLVQATAVPGLSVLTAGRCDRRALQALAQGEAGDLLTRLRADYDFILLDACPVLPVADALLLGQHADAVLLAVLRNFSRLPAVYEAQRRLAALDIPMLGAVVLGESTDSYGAERYLAEMKK